MPKQIKFVSSGLSTILALVGIFIVLYQMLAYDYFKLEYTDITTNIGLYSSKISSNNVDTFVKNDTILGCNSESLPDSLFNNCRTLHILYPLQILALALLITTFVPQLQSAGLITGVVCIIIGVYILIQFGKIKDTLCEGNICTDDKVGFSYYLNFGLIGIGILLMGTTLNSFNLFNMKIGKRRNNNPYASYYTY